MSETHVYLILSTVGEDKARELARKWVESRRAACVSILPGAKSTYHWQGKIAEEREAVLLIKTAFRTPEEGKRLIRSFAEDHPYEEPEFLVFDATDGAEGYIQWVLANVGERREKSGMH